MRRLVTAALVALLAAPAPVVRAAAPRTAYGTTTFSSAAGGVTTFTLPRASTFRHRGAMLDGISISGRGRVVGLVLTSDDLTASGGAIVYALRVNWCWDRGCSTPRDVRLGPWTFARANGLAVDEDRDGVRYSTLPAGRYRAYVLSDGAPVEVTVRFNGARGSGRLVPDRAVRATYVTAHDTIGADAALPVSVYSAGATTNVRSPLAVVVSATELRYRTHVTDTTGACLYANSRPPNGVFVRGCPGGESTPVFTFNGVGDVDVGSLSVTLVTADRDGVEWTMGTYADAVRESEWTSPTALLWLELG